MANFRKAPKSLLRQIHTPPQIAYKLGLGPLIGQLVLLLTTTGRKSGEPRVTPLQYEEIDGRIYLGSALGLKADWVRNILANPEVKIKVKSREFTGFALVITDPLQITDFLEVRLQRHPRMMGMLMKREGLVAHPTRDELGRHAEQLALVIVTPENEQTNERKN
jgi:deazaflavin-dependent oxidoreductase (nitroreductase family)